MSRPLQIICAAAVLAGVIVCAVIDLRAAAVLSAVCGVLTLCTQHSHRRIREKQLRLCDEIDRILSGAEQIRLDSYSEGEFSILASEIQKMTVRLREQNSALQHEHDFMKEALEDMSHQLRTPLTSMMLHTEMLRSPELTRQQQILHIQEISALLLRMQWLIETMLTLSRVDAGAVVFRSETVSCAEIIRDALEPIAVSLELKDITADVRITGTPAFIGDRGYCTEALGNLLKNCMEHTPEGGRISVEAAENPLYTGILITDTGAGISEADLPHIFERFYRSSDFAKKGYGIGLAFARRVITEQSGSIQVRNASPHGAQFDIRFYKTVV